MIDEEESYQQAPPVFISKVTAIVLRGELRPSETYEMETRLNE